MLGWRMAIGFSGRFVAENESLEEPVVFRDGAELPSAAAVAKEELGEVLHILLVASHVPQLPECSGDEDGRGGESLLAVHDVIALQQPLATPIGLFQEHRSEKIRLLSGRGVSSKVV